MIFSHRIDGLTLRAECDPDLKAQAEALLAALADMHKCGPALRAGSTVLFGWVQLRLEPVEQGLCVCEPDLLGETVEHYVPRVDYTLSVLDEQARLIQQLGCPSKVTLYTDAIVLAQGCLAESRIYLERRAAVQHGDSGWYIGPVEPRSSNEEALELVPAYQLLSLRPEVMPVLALPQGYIATFHGELLEAILDNRDVRVWPRNVGSLP